MEPWVWQVISAVGTIMALLAVFAANQRKAGVLEQEVRSLKAWRMERDRDRAADLREARQAAESLAATLNRLSERVVAVEGAVATLPGLGAKLDTLGDRLGEVERHGAASCATQKAMLAQVTSLARSVEKLAER